jgi:Flp pilus assembly protein TadG
MSNIKQQGSSTVEFAIMLPLLLLLVVMVSEFGIMYYRLNAVTKSVQIAARYLSDVSVNNTNTSIDTTNAKNLAVYGNSAGIGTPVVPSLAIANIAVTNPDSKHVQVVATYNSSLILGNSLNALMSLATGSSAATNFMTLKATSVMRFAQ